MLVLFKKGLKVVQQTNRSHEASQHEAGKTTTIEAHQEESSQHFQATAAAQSQAADEFRELIQIFWACLQIGDPVVYPMISVLRIYGILILLVSLMTVWYDICPVELLRSRLNSTPNTAGGCFWW